MDAFEHYKNLHKIPEISGCEFLTSKYIKNTLSDIGYTPCSVGETGVFADLFFDNNLPWLLFRADIDALAIKENTKLPYSSQNEGVMHACGHDAHTAMLLQAAAILKNAKLPHNIRFLFQPAEETTLGAAKVIADNVIPQNLIACFALHVWPNQKFGTFVTKSGALMASSDVFRIKYYGKSSHCSQEEKGNNALLSAVDTVSLFPQLKTKYADEETLLFCGSIHSGNAHNIIPDKAQIYGTLRTYSERYQNTVKTELKNAAEAISKRYGTTAEVTFEGGSPPVYNDNKIVNILKEHFNVSDNAQKTMAAEDFAYFGKFAPSAMLWLGIGNVPALHSQDFFIPQEILPIGTDFWTKLALFDWNELLK